jgi:hypothetical protein
MFALGHKKIHRLDVVVDDFFGVGRLERLGNPDSQVQALLQAAKACRKCDASTSARRETP